MMSLAGFSLLSLETPEDALENFRIVDGRAQAFGEFDHGVHAIMNHSDRFEIKLKIASEENVALKYLNRHVSFDACTGSGQNEQILAKRSSKLNGGLQSVERKTFAKMRFKFLLERLHLRDHSLKFSLVLHEPQCPFIHNSPSGVFQPG